ncbi:PqqD family protein [Sporanaerobacter acetigenes]|uniref:PqqD family protein n=1 Tax=Sporanaerobacter acetigenes TaxID=165813 RepID=UPI00104E6F3D|nr:PqqD family protein [Sporanaerobacter acetigenes]
MLNRKIKLIEDFQIKKENDVFIIINSLNNNLLVTNEIGKLILDNSEKTIKDIIEIIHQQFENVDVEEIQKDTLEFIEECQKKGVITIE